MSSRADPLQLGRALDEAPMTKLHVRFWLLAGLGIMLGDKLGRRRIFKFDLWLFVVFSLLCVVAWDATSLIAFRFMLGIAIGLDYPIAASYLAEILPAQGRGRWLVAAFSLQAAGILLGAMAGVVILESLPEVDSWRIMLGFGVVPALVIIFLRRGTPESPRWLAATEARRRPSQWPSGSAGIRSW